jgi:hypothetical protein
MLRAFRRQSPTDSQTLGLLCSEKCTRSISRTDRAAAVVPAVSALRDSTWNAKQNWGRWVIPVTVKEWRTGVSIRHRCCDSRSFRRRVSRCQLGWPRTSWDGTRRFRCGGITRPEGRRWAPLRSPQDRPYHRPKYWRHESNILSKCHIRVQLIG